MMMRQTKMRCYMSVIIGKRHRRILGHFHYFFGRDGSHFPISSSVLLDVVSIHHYYSP